jgi:hypothetical protein
MTTITLELVRHGPLHNQLLSPLTPYIALAGNRPVETVYVSVEHAQVLARLRRLHHSVEQADDDSAFRRETDLREASLLVTRFFEQIRGLSDAIAEAVPQRERGGVVHLRLIVSANELALLPFELAQGPLALGGSDMLSTLRPPEVVITRESRRALTTELQLRPSREYRVLLVTADPLGLGIPREACALALRRAYPAEILSPLEEHVVGEFRETVSVVEAASLDDVRLALMYAAAAGRKFTHVLVLAHGAMPETLDGTPAVLLHHGADRPGADHVSGDRLAAAVCGCAEEDRPTFVGLLTCGSGYSPRILFAGGSLAHSLHESGIPFVVASQFPLTHAGAALVVEELMSRLWRNRHPIGAITAVRRRLFTNLPESHDWGGLVAYATLPSDESLDREVKELEFESKEWALYRAFSKLEGLSHRGLEVPPTLEAAFRLSLAAFRADFDERVLESLARLESSGDPHDAPETQRVFESKWIPNQQAAFVIGNAYLRLARLEAGEQVVAKAVRDNQRVQSPLRDAIRYADWHLRLGGRRASTINQYTLAAALLQDGATSRDFARRWWWVADWHMSQSRPLSEEGAQVGHLLAVLQHLMLGTQVDGLDHTKLIASFEVVLEQILDLLARRSDAADLQETRRFEIRLGRVQASWFLPSAPIQALASSALARLRGVSRG